MLFWGNPLPSAPAYTLPLSAFAGALLMAGLIYSLAWNNGSSPVLFILMGVGLSAIAFFNLDFNWYTDFDSLTFAIAIPVVLPYIKISPLAFNRPNEHPPSLSALAQLVGVSDIFDKPLRV